MIDRRTLLAGAGAATVAAAAPARGPDPRFPDGFLWGAATAAHQVHNSN